MSSPTGIEAALAAPGSGVTPELIKARLEAKIEASYVSIDDESYGCGQRFVAIIVSPKFVKKKTLDRHRLVHDALKHEIAAIHSWTAKCHTPAEWEKKKPQ